MKEDNTGGRTTASATCGVRNEETVIVKAKAEFETQTIFFGLRRRQYATKDTETVSTEATVENENICADVEASGAVGESNEANDKADDAESTTEGTAQSTGFRPGSRTSASLSTPFRTKTGKIVTRSSKRFVRSFEQFQQLHDYLLAKYPGFFVPSLPTMPFHRLLTDAEHVDKKKRRVAVFLDRVQDANAAYADDQCLMQFCTPGVFAGPLLAPRSPTFADEVTRARGMLSSMFGSISGNRGVDRIGESGGVSQYIPGFMSSFTSILGPTARTEVVNDDDDIQNGILDYEAMKAGVTHIQSDCNAIVESITESDSARRKMAVHYARLGQSLHHLSRTEPRGSFADLLAMVAHSIVNIQQLTYTQAKRNIASIGDTYTQIVRDILNINRTIDHRNKQLDNYQDQTKNVRKTSREYAVCNAGGSGYTEAETDIAQYAHDQALKDKDEAKMIYIQTQRDLSDQWAEYENYRIEQLNKTIISYVDTQVDCNTHQLKVWEALLADLERS
eukprot:CFRG6070T1